VNPGFDTDWLANISIKWVLVAVGILLVLRMSMARGRSPGRQAADSAAEFMESALIAIVLVFLVIRPFVVQAFYIPSGSMIPTLQVGDRILVNKFVYRVSKPNHGDVVVFVAPHSASPDEKDFIKRIVGLPGDRVSVVPTHVLADGKVVAAFVGTSSGGYFNAQDFHSGISQQPAAIEVGTNTDPPSFQDGKLIVHRSGGERFEIIPVRDLNVRIDGSTVYNGNDYIQAFPGEFDIRENRDLAAYGGSPNVDASVILVNGDPRLILVKARKLSFDPSHIALNGKAVKEPYIAEPPDYSMGEVKVPPGHYWVMGDNRNDSNDSHQWGFLKGDRIVGRAEAIFWPIRRIQLIRTH
jgi:signal peptidase I